ncbi:serine-rich single-pass membrane protein 1 [Ochotona curzoniae]|uniref:serine-rich single-pass membrane protein 1 n=1 Tax=Ochotona curzoniae TaxID=130825 RepID=UPI001B34EF60|nr:serine-rich single-pass membrane protein 1 [Ochotona curzoniae]
MGDLFSLFWEVDPSPIPLSLTIPSQDAECGKDDSCGTIGSFLLWYFIIILVLMLCSRASIWMSDCKKNKDAGTHTSVSKAIRDPRCEWQNKDGTWLSSQMMRKPQQSQFTPVTDSEVALINAYLAKKRAKLHFQFNQVNENHGDSDTSECDTAESDSGASSWKESETERPPSPGSITRRRSLVSYQVRERPCLHCKAIRTDEWLTRHFLQNNLIATPMKGDTQEETSSPEINTKFSSF